MDEKIIDIEITEDTIDLEKIEDVSQIIDTVSFSGAASFEYVTGKRNSDIILNEKLQNNVNLDNTLSISPQIPFSTLDSKWDFNFKDFSVEKSELTEDSNKCDIEVVFEMKNSSDNSNESSDEYSITATIADTEYSDIKTLYKGSVDDSGKFKFEKQLLGLNLQAEMTDGKSDEKDDEKFIETTKGVLAEFKISGLSICSSGFIELDNPENPANNIELRVSADEISIKSTIKTGIEKQYKIAEIPVPISTGVSVNLGLYIVIGVNGEISLWYKIEKPYIGMTYDNQNGLTPIHGRFGDGTGVKAQAELELGLIGEAEISVCGCNIIDPSIDVRVNGTVATFDMPIGYELKPQYNKNNCLELEVQLPIITLSATTGNDSVIYKALSNLKLTKELKLIEKDSSFIYKTGYHIENENNGDISFFELNLNGKNPEEHKTVCTHIKEIKRDSEITKNQTSISGNSDGNNIIDGSIEKIETEIDEELQEQEDKIMAIITAKIEDVIVDILDEIFVEVCG